jgi:aminopeptidase N
MSGTERAPITRRRRPGRRARFALAALCALLACLSTAGATSAAAGSGDPFFPDSGSRAYDVLHYDVRLAYRPGSGQLRATARIEATALEALRRFSLDLDGLQVTAVTVDGTAARFSRAAGKLKVVPAQPLEAGRPFAVAVSYRGRPETITDPDGSSEGWIPTPDGAVALGEPVGTAAWLPCDNSLRDKAAFGFQVTVPKGLKGVANGRLRSVRRHGGTATFAWQEDQPMAPYLATVDIGRGRLLHSEIDGLPAWTLVDPRLARESRPAIDALGKIVRFESRIFGPYPFDALGSVVDPAPVGYALETQTRPTYAYAPPLTDVVHETAHQWFGDSVGLTRWPEIWLNEGFATWTEWYYAERHGGPSAARTFRRLYRTPASTTAFWDPPSGHPGTAKNLFGSSVYLRGGLALEALRMKIGTKPMLTLLRDWATAHRYANATIPQFISLAEEISGRPLGPFFRTWLYQRGKPGGYG